MSDKRRWWGKRTILQVETKPGVFEPVKGTTNVEVAIVSAAMTTVSRPMRHRWRFDARLGATVCIRRGCRKRKHYTLPARSCRIKARRVKV